MKHALKCESLEIHLSDEWNAVKRSELRSAAGQFAGRDFSDLSALPHDETWSLSLTHCKSAGGFAAVKKPLRVGLDLEIADRIEERVVRRVSSNEEVATAPNVSLLWVGKEALFKSLREFDQPSVLGELRLLNWQKIEHPLTLEGKTIPAWFFNGERIKDRQQIPGRGVVIKINAFALSLFLSSSST